MPTPVLESIHSLPHLLTFWNNHPIEGQLLSTTLSLSFHCMVPFVHRKPLLYVHSLLVQTLFLNKSLYVYKLIAWTLFTNTSLFLKTHWVLFSVTPFSQAQLSSLSTHFLLSFSSLSWPLLNSSCRALLHMVLELVLAGRSIDWCQSSISEWCQVRYQDDVKFDISARSLVAANMGWTRNACDGLKDDGLVKFWEAFMKKILKTLISSNLNVSSFKVTVNGQQSRRISDSRISPNENSSEGLRATKRPILSRRAWHFVLSPRNLL